MQKTVLGKKLVCINFRIFQKHYIGASILQIRDVQIKG